MLTPMLERLDITEDLGSYAITFDQHLISEYREDRTDLLMAFVQIAAFVFQLSFIILKSMMLS